MSMIVHDELIHDIFRKTTMVFQTLPDEVVGPYIQAGSKYCILVECHLSLCLKCTKEIFDNRDPNANMDARRDVPYELLQLCIRNRQEVVDRFNLVGGNAGLDLDDAQVEALWWVLMLRSICWWASIEMEPPLSRIRSKYYYSQLPVYLA